jgi:hypothetical protein
MPRCATLVIAHLSTTRGDRVVAIDAGRLVERTHAELLQRGGLVTRGCTHCSSGPPWKRPMALRAAGPRGKMAPANRRVCLKMPRCASD